MSKLNKVYEVVRVHALLRELDCMCEYVESEHKRRWLALFRRWWSEFSAYPGQFWIWEVRTK